MANWFNRSLQMPKVKHSTFDLSNDYKTSINIGKLCPVGLEEIIPSDRILSHSNETFIRFAPLKFPVMHRIKVHTSNFFVPFRIILGDSLYEDFLNNKVNIVPASFVVDVDKSETPSNPFLNTVLDYLGYDIYAADLDTTTSEYKDIWTLKLDNPLPYLSYLCICRDWYTDSILEKTWMSAVDEVVEFYRESVEAGTEFSFIGSEFNSPLLFSISYSKDYFNTARPEPQLGPQMYVLNRPVQLSGIGPDDKEHKAVLTYDQLETETSEGAYLSVDPTLGVKYYDTLVDINEETTIRDLWKKEMLQRYYEIDNTFGSRIREKLAGHYGVRYSDSRLQIPLLCGGSSSYAQISEVMSHSDTDNASIGDYTGKAIVATRANNSRVYFEEHGYYMTLLSLIPDNGYCRGQQRTLFKQNIFDFASPEFNNIGYQDVYNGELYMNNSDEVGDNKGTFGYQPRYSEYRSHPSRCTGNFRKDAELAYHLNRNFAGQPPLNANFIKVSDTDRIFQSTDVFDYNEPLYVDIYHHLVMSRPISYEPDSLHLY